MIKYSKHIIVVIGIVFTAVSFFSCGKESSCFKGSGTTITEQRAINNEVTEITIEDNIDLVLTQGTESSLMIEGGGNLLPYINTDISGKSLKLTSDNKCGFFRDYNKPLTAYLTLPNLTHMNINGQSNISSVGILICPSLELDLKKATGTITLNIDANDVSVRQHTGPADIYLTGTTNTLYAYSGGGGWLYLEDLQAKYTHVNHDGGGDISVRADSTLLVELTSIGNINYYGNPVVTISINSGSGKLNKKN